jgi:hypothetical protein
MLFFFGTNGIVAVGQSSRVEEVNGAFFLFKIPEAELTTADSDHTTT